MHYVVEHENKIKIKDSNCVCFSIPKKRMEEGH